MSNLHIWNLSGAAARTGRIKKKVNRNNRK